MNRQQKRINRHSSFTTETEIAPPRNIVRKPKAAPKAKRKAAPKRKRK